MRSQQHHSSDKPTQLAEPLPPGCDLKGWYGWLIVVVATLTAGLGVYSGIAGIFGGGS